MQTQMLAAFLIGILTGLRSIVPVAVLSWAARLGWIHLDGTWLAFLSANLTSYILSALALGELITDKLPMTPSRKVPIQFGGRILAGAFCGIAMATPHGAAMLGLILGAIGAVIGTLGGARLRTRLGKGFGMDFPAALIEDAIAMAGAILVVSRLA